MQETRRNNGGMASELVHKYVIVHIKGERTKMVRALSYASREASVLKQKKKFPPRIETSKQVFSPTGVLVRATLSTTMDRDHRQISANQKCANLLLTSPGIEPTTGRRSGPRAPY